jgi:NADH:ubiquinone oxidoreductase subunit E
MNEQEREILTQFAKKRSNLLPILQRFQETEKYISPEIIAEIGQYLDISENDIYSVAGFYPGFRFAAPGGHKISVCLCLACRLKGGNEILAALEKELGISAGQTTGDLKFSLDRITLSGCSGSSPAMTVDQEAVDNMTPEKIKELISKYS